MSFDALMRSITHSRDSSDLVSSTAISTSIPITYQPSELCILRTSVSGCSIYGECLISGTDANDASIAEHIVFTQDDKRISQNLFKTLVGVTTANFVNGTIRIQGALRSGEDLNTRRSLGTVYGRIYDPQPREGVRVVGAVQDQPLKFMCRKEDSSILKGDYLVDGGITYSLESNLQPMYGLSVIHHYESIVSRLES